MKNKWRTGLMVTALALTLAAWVGVRWANSAERANLVDKAASEEMWLHDVEIAFARAEAEGKPLVIDFYADWCLPCKEMDRTTFRDAAVVERLQAFVPLKVDIDARGDVARRFGVTALPTTVITTPNGEPVSVEVGYLNAEQYLALLPATDEAVTVR